MVVDSFYENVSLHVMQHRELAAGEQEQNVVLQFTPKPAQSLLIACLYSHGTDPKEPDVRGFAAMASTSLIAQEAAPNRQQWALRAQRLISGKTDEVITNAVILVDGEKIAAVGPSLAIPDGAKVIDLGNATLLPGLIDIHTHLLEQLDGTNRLLQDVEMLRIVATQSSAERALLGVKLAREDLEAGITTVRDVGNSGVNGDVALRRAMKTAGCSAHGW